MQDTNANIVLVSMINTVRECNLLCTAQVFLICFALFDIISAECTSVFCLTGSSGRIRTYLIVGNTGSKCTPLQTQTPRFVFGIEVEPSFAEVRDGTDHLPPFA